MVVNSMLFLVSPLVDTQPDHREGRELKSDEGSEIQGWVAGLIEKVDHRERTQE